MPPFFYKGNYENINTRSNCNDAVWDVHPRRYIDKREIQRGFFETFGR